MDIGGTFTHEDSNLGRVREIGGWWIAFDETQDAALVTWRVPGVEIDDAALSEKERYVANLVAVRALIDRIRIDRTGLVMDAKATNDKRRAHLKSLRERRDR